MAQNVFQQKISSVISDPNINIVEFDNSFDYRESFIYIDPSISDIERLLDSFFIGGWTIEKGDYNLYYKISSSRSDDCLNLACFLNYIGIAFSSSLEQFPIVEIQNLPPNFNSIMFNQMNEQFLKVPISYSTFIDNGGNCTGYILARNMQCSNELIKKMNMASISNFQIKAFHKYSSPSSTSSSNIKIFSSSSSSPPLPYQHPGNHGIPPQTPSQFYAAPTANNQAPQNPTFQNNSNAYTQNHPSAQVNPPKPPTKVKEVLIYPASLIKTVHVEQPLYITIDRLRTMVEKFGKVDKLSIIETKSDSQIFEVVYNKTGSCDTLLKSNQYKDCSKKADTHLSPVPISPPIQYYPEEDQNPSSNLSLFDIRGNTVIIALEKDDDLKPFMEKMTNFGVFSRIVYQLFEDRKEVAVTFLHSGSSKTLLKCKEFLSSAVMAEDLFKYRSSQQPQQMHIQNQQQQPFIPPQQPPPPPFSPQQQQLPNPHFFNFGIQQQPPFPGQIQPHLQQPNFNPQLQQAQFFPQQPNFPQFQNNGGNPANNSNNNNNPGFFMGQAPPLPLEQYPYVQKQPLIMSSSQNPYNSDAF